MNNKIIALLTILAIIVALTGCNAQQQQADVSQLAPGNTPEATAMPTASPDKEIKAVGIVLMDVPEAEQKVFPVPEAYRIADVENDITLPYGMGFTLYYFTDKDGKKEYRAFGQNFDENGKVKEQGWYAVEIVDIPMRVNDISSLSAGNRLLAVWADGEGKAGEIDAAYMTGKDNITADIFEKHDVIQKTVKVIGQDARPVDTDMEKTMYGEAAPSEMPETSEPSTSKPVETKRPAKNEDKDDSDTGEEKPTTPTPTKSDDGKTWHDAVYKDVWIVDVPASSYEEPVYEMKEIARCTTCDADVTSDPGAHMKEHMLKGENGNWRSEWIQVQTGTKTVNVPEQGHWERQLVKEAGYY